MTASKNGLLNTYSLICGAVCAFFCIMTMVISGSPYEMIHKFNSVGMLPPMWLWRLCFLVWSFLSGVSVGTVFYEGACGRLSPEREAVAYKGGIFFTFTLFLFCLQYPLFFSLERLFVSFLFALGALICSVFCAVIWSKIFRTASILLVGVSFWQLYAVFVNACVLISN